MKTNKPHDERQVNRSQTNNEQTESMSVEHPGYHYVKNHDYDSENFALEGDTVNFNGIRVVNKSNSREFEEFAGFREMKQSGWTVNYPSAARSIDGTVLYEGRL